MGRYSVGVAGESFRNDDGGDRQAEIARCRVGEPVALVRDAANRHDSNCVKVMSARGVQIGNVGREAAVWIAQRIDGQRPVSAEIDSIGDGGGGLLGVVLSVATDAGDGRGAPRRESWGESLMGVLGSDPTRSKAPPVKLGCAGMVAIIFVLIVLAKACDPSTSTTGDVKMATIDPAVCDQALAELTSAGLIRERPAANRINVDERLWAALPANQKKQTAAAVRCSLTRGQPSSGADDYGVVYGYRSGKRLAMAATESIVTIE